ncbi:Pilus assembly protein [Pseudomonas marincola]|uniref:Pilus assembly protein n=1 Tax=Pseudomonas marincola TaxID=437900 RepID=A0A1I7D4F9_9PSED|nr:MULTISPECIES: pilus assembly protein [Pseudomonas]OEO23390.1 pilus assembly protein [Pseudomonas sp. J237]CAE6889441.1 Pilus assembly protein [Pseudomonas marincola]SFU06521.1 pilus assembly protein CpaE [Pseudomonas marincola]
MSQTFLALTRNSADLEWLQGSLSSLGHVLQAGQGALDELLALVDVTGAGLLFVGLDRDNLMSQSALIEGVLAAKPMLAVIALGDGLDNQLVLSAMRAGARDFIAYGARTSEVTGLVRHMSKRMPNLQPSADRGKLSVLYCRQQDADAGMLAAHLALAIEQNGRRTLLLDLGLPYGESLGLFALESSFNFSDALRNLRRLDSSLIDSAFCETRGGLRVLSLTEQEQTLEKVSAAELYLLMGTLRQHFQHIVVNLAGQPDSEALRWFATHAEQLLWCSDQNVPSCQRNIELLEQWRESGMKLAHASLLVDRFLRNVAPDSPTLGKSFGLPVIETLPFNPELRMNARNQGRSLFEIAPRDRLSQSLKQLGCRLADRRKKSSAWRWPWKQAERREQEELA